jgi:hypothetical protein
MVRSIVSVFLMALVLSVVPAFAEPPPVRFEVNLGAYAPRLSVTAYLNFRVGGTG